MFTIARNLGYSGCFLEKIETETKKKGITSERVDIIAAIAFAIIAFLGLCGALPVSIGMIFTALTTIQVIAYVLLHLKQLGLEGKMDKMLGTKVKNSGSSI